jgi:hypothetical protein
MNKNGLPLGDDGEFTVDLDVGSNGMWYNSKSKSIEKNKQNFHTAKPETALIDEDCQVVLKVVAVIVLTVMMLVAVYGSADSQGYSSSQPQYCSVDYSQGFAGCREVFLRECGMTVYTDGCRVYSSLFECIQGSH